MQRIRDIGHRAGVFVGELSTGVVFQNFVMALAASLVSAVPLPHAAAALGTALAAAENSEGAFPPAVFAGAALGRFAASASSGRALLAQDIAAYALICIFCLIGIKFGKKLKRIPDPALAASAIALSRLFSMRLLAMDWIVLVTETLSAALLCPVFTLAAGVFMAGKKRLLLSGDEALATVFTLAVMLAGMADISFLSISPAMILSYLMILVVACCAPVGVAAAAASVAGLALAIGLGGKWDLIGCLALCSIAASLFSRIGKLASAISFILANALITLFVNSSTEILIPLGASIPAACIFMALPKKLLKRLSPLLSESVAAADGDDAISRRAAIAIDQKINGVAKVFDKMSECFEESTLALSASSEDEISEMLRIVSGEVCRGCALVNICWKREYETTYDAMEDALTRARQKGHFEARMLKPQFARRCMRTSRLTECANRLSSLYALQKKWEYRLSESRSLSKEQLAGAAEVMRSLRREITVDIGFGGEAERGIRLALDRLNMPRPVNVTVFKNNSGCEVRIAFDRCERSGAAEDCLSAVTAALGLNMRLMPNTDDDDDTVFVFAETAKYYVRYSHAEKICDGYYESGDSFICSETTPDHVLLLVADGMGSGNIARAESSSAAELMRSMLSAGLRTENALMSVNKLLRLRSGNEMFTSLDAAHIDCQSGICEITKLGAAPGLLIRAGSMHEISIDALPLGIDDTVISPPTRLKLEVGDGVILMSDGITDAIGKSSLPVICMTIWRDSLGDPDVFCRSMLDAAVACSGDIPSDDMTIVAGVLTEESA